MGLLDDAIREHLDLKRRRGADPTEVERAEQEALGPVRRGPVAQPPELVLDAEHQPEWDDDYEEPDAPAAAPGGAVSYGEPDAPLEPRVALPPELFGDEGDPFGDQGPVEAGAYDEPDSPPVPAEHPEPVLLDEPVPPPHRAPLPRDQLGETVEYDVEDALDEPGGPGESARPPAPPRGQKAPEGVEDDPLEETPEFLQETPDHDRLWFEQRPPRDFDFDG